MHKFAKPMMIPALAMLFAGPVMAQEFSDATPTTDGVGVPAPGQQTVRTPVENLMGTPPLRYDDQTSGSLTGSYDADDAIWFLDPPGVDDLPATGWTETDDGIQVRLVGYPTASPDSLDGVLQISFTMTGGVQERRAQEVRVTHDPLGDGPFLVATSPNIDFNVTALERQGDTLAISGDIVATVSPTPSGDLTISDPSTIVIDGNFMATIIAPDM